jgi:hypothetical protein
MLSLLFLSASCARVALRMSPPLVQNMMVSVFEECDPQLAREAVPANLKVLEGLAKTDPDNRDILEALAMGFAGYALLFLEEDDPGRASGFYLRSRGYALRALGAGGDILMDAQEGDRVPQVLRDMGPADLQALFWTAFAWNAWINLHLDKPEAVSQLGVAQACLERVLAIDRGYFHGLPEIMQGAILSARPQLLGGEKEKARSHFQKGLERSGGKFFPARYYYARYHAVSGQDRDLFRRLLGEIVNGEPRTLKEMCLVNTVFQQKAARLLEREEELFY